MRIKYRSLTLLNRVVELTIGLTLVLLVLRALVGDRWPIVGMFNHLFPLALVPALALLPVALLLDRKRLMLLVIPPFVALNAGSMGIFFTRPARLETSVPLISLLTYNLHAETTLLDPMVDIIRDANADLVALQELSDEAATRFAQVFEETYPYRAFHPQAESIIGPGVMSRFPILEDEFITIDDRPGFQRVALDVHDTRVVLYNVHPKPPRLDFTFNVRPREHQLQQVLSRSLKDEGPVILAGDFNMTESSDDYRRVARHYTDVYRRVGRGFGFTFPDNRSFGMPTRMMPITSRIDYVFHSKGLQSARARVWPRSGGSDHRPVYAILALETS